jgi:hypothetical protein
MIEEARRKNLMKTKTVIANKHTDRHAQNSLVHVFPILLNGITQNSLLQAAFQEFLSEN